MESRASYGVSGILEKSEGAVHCVDVRNLSKRFGGLTALSDFTFHVDDGEILALIGPNGAGKTTLFNVVTGFLRPNGGKVVFWDRDITGRPPHEIAKMGIVRTFQLNMLFPSQTVLENVLLAFHLHSGVPYVGSILNTQKARSEKDRLRKDAQEIIDFFGLSTVQNSVVQTLPHGQQRYVGIAIALAAAPKVLLLDEPATGLSEEEKAFLLEKIHQIRKRGTTIILVEHNMRFVMEVSDRIVVLNFGKKIAEGSPREITGNPAVIKAYLGDKYVNTQSQ